jgi:hypothetical protein
MSTGIIKVVDQESKEHAVAHSKRMFRGNILVLQERVMSMTMRNTNPYIRYMFLMNQMQTADFPKNHPMAYNFIIVKDGKDSYIHLKEVKETEIPLKEYIRYKAMLKVNPKTFNSKTDHKSNQLKTAITKGDWKKAMEVFKFLSGKIKLPHRFMDLYDLSKCKGMLGGNKMKDHYKWITFTKTIVQAINPCKEEKLMNKNGKVKKEHIPLQLNPNPTCNAVTGKCTQTLVPYNKLFEQRFEG